MEISIKQIADYIKAAPPQKEDTLITGVAELQNAQPGDISFLANPKYEAEIYSTKASAVIVSEKFQPKKPINTTLLKVDDPYLAFTQLLHLVQSQLFSVPQGIAPTAVIADNVKIGKNVSVGHLTVIGSDTSIGSNTQLQGQVYIGEGVSIGTHCIIHPGARILNGCIIGNHCEIHAGAVIGGDGFGYAPQKDGSFIKIPQIGNVIIEDYVSIGCNACVDRATVSSTIIRKGVKIDNLVQVAHNCEIGENTVIAGQAGIAGSTKIGKNCMLAGQVGIGGHVVIADGTKIGPQAGVMSDVKEQGKELMGTPVIDVKEYMRVYAANRKVPELIKRVQKLENKA